MYIMKIRMTTFATRSNNIYTILDAVAWLLLWSYALSFEAYD